MIRNKQKLKKQNEKKTLFGFALFSKSISIKCGSLLKTCPNKKTTIFECLKYFASPEVLNKQFSKKNPHPNSVLFLTNKKSAGNRESFINDRRKTCDSFSLLWLRNLPEGGIWEFWACDNFCSAYRDLSPLKVSSIFAGPFLRNTGKRGGGAPLN